MKVRAFPTNHKDISDTNKAIRPECNWGSSEQSHSDYIVNMVIPSSKEQGIVFTFERILRDKRI